MASSSTSSSTYRPVKVNVDGTSTFKDTGESTGLSSYSDVQAARSNGTLTGPGYQSSTLSGSKTPSAPKVSPAVVTSQPATNNLTTIANANSNIQQGLINKSVVTKAATALPKIQGYNVSATPLQGSGATKMTTGDGQDYYIQPTTQDQNTAATPPAQTSASDLYSSLYGGDNNATDTSAATTAQKSQDIQSTIDNENNDFSNKTTDYLAQQDQAYKAFQGSISNLLSSPITLTPTEQALIDATNQSFQSQIATQQATNQSYTGGVTAYGVSQGLNEYAPLIAMGNIKASVDQGVAKVADIDGKRVQAVAQLQQGFEQLERQFTQDNVKAVTDSYNAYQALSKEKIDTLTTMHSDVLNQAKDLRDYNMNVEKLSDDNYFKDRQMTEQEKQDAFDQAYKMEDLALKKQAADGTGMAGGVVVSTDPAGKPNTDEQQAFLANLPPATATMVQQLASYTANPANLSIKNNQRQNMLSLVHQYDPTYDESQYAARAAYNKSLQSGTLSQSVVAANKAISHLITFSNSVADLKNTNIPGVGGIVNNVKQSFSPSMQAKVAEADTEKNGVKDELAKFFKGSGATDVQSIDDWSKTLSADATPGAMKGTVQGAINLLAGQLDVLNQQYTSTMGKPPAGSILQPETVTKLSTLKNQGYDVEIPGVPYTDAKAYVQYDSNGANNLKAVVSAYPNLSQADALQLAQQLDQ